MEATKIYKLIENKNEKLEQYALREAEGIIESIAEEQKRISTSNERIADLRKQLKDLNVQQLDKTELLGE